MALRLPDKWVWDFWLAEHGDRHHVFYLQAPRSLGDSNLRHHHASIGHAVSSDLTRWSVLPDALQPGPPGSWDDLATWTGSVLAHDGRWYMLYTGINRSERGLIQRIGLATSDDLSHWQKHGDNPVLEADPRWYELLEPSRWRDQSWRDPWLFVDPGDGSIGCLLTARSRHGAPDGAGVIGRARTRDFVHWDVLPPVTTPGEFAQVECPQLISCEGRSLILFSCLEEDHAPARVLRLGRRCQTGTYLYAAPELWGRYTPSQGPIARPDGAEGPLYAGKIVATDAREWSFIAFRGAGDRAFVGELTDPLPLALEPNGDLRVLGARASTPSELDVARS